MDSVNIQIGSNMDPTGSVFEEYNYILRGINPEFSAYYSSLLENSVIQGLIGSSIIDTEIDSGGLPGYPLTFRHRKISPKNFPYEWAPAMLLDAAVLTLDLCMELNMEGLVLKDATPWNIIFDHSNAVFVDFTSIMPQDENLTWVAYDQFLRLFLFPLLISSGASPRMGRVLLMDSANGVSDTELVKLLPSFWLRKPWLIQRLYLTRLLVSMVRHSGSDMRIKEMSKKIRPTLAQRGHFFRSLKNDVLTLAPATGQSRWSKYYDDINNFFNPSCYHLKQQAISTILESCKPQTVVDIGCNQGGYSIMAARSGAQVTAFDTDEDSVNLLYKLTKEKGLNILPLVMNALNPSPQCGWRGIQFDNGPKRFRAEMAMALALTHHLAITQVQTFDRIVQTLDDYAEKWLLTEFVPATDPRSVELLTTNTRDMAWYTLENFIGALGRVYSKIETFPSYPEGRTLCLCTK